MGCDNVFSQQCKDHLSEYIEMCVVVTPGANHGYSGKNKPMSPLFGYFSDHTMLLNIF